MQITEQITNPITCTFHRIDLQLDRMNDKCTRFFTNYIAAIKGQSRQNVIYECNH